MSKNSINSAWVKDEYAFARDLYNKKELIIIPIAIDDCEIPGFYNNYKCIDCRQGITPKSFFMILSAMYGSVENMREEKDVYVSYSWKKEREQVDAVFETIRKFPFRLIGDATDQVKYDENNRIQKIMNTCGGFIGILPYREGTNTSRYIVDEIKKAEECRLPGIIVADSRVKNIESITSYPIFRIEDYNNIDVDQLEDFISLLNIKRPKKPHIFFSTSFDKSRKSINTLIRNLAGNVTATPCILGENIDHANLQQQIVDKIKEAYVMIADITGDDKCSNCDKIGTDINEQTFRLNTCIEAGIARGADTELFILAKKSSQSTPFMFRDINIRYYEDDCEFIATVHRVLRPYRRSVL